MNLEWITNCMASSVIFRRFRRSLIFKRLAIVPSTNVIFYYYSSCVDHRHDGRCGFDGRSLLLSHHHTHRITKERLVISNPSHTFSTPSLFQHISGYSLQHNRLDNAFFSSDRTSRQWSVALQERYRYSQQFHQKMNVFMRGISCRTIFIY